MLEMTLQETMAVLTFACKSAEMLEQSKVGGVVSRMNLDQWTAQGDVVRPILRRLDADNPAMLPLPHDGVAWRNRP